MFQYHAHNNVNIVDDADDVRNSNENGNFRNMANHLADVNIM